MDCSAAAEAEASSVAGSGGGGGGAMAVGKTKTMEGWLYLFRANRFGLHQRSKRRYFVLQHDNCLNCYKTAAADAAASSTARKQCPIRSARIDSCIRVSDNGRETINGKVFFLFTVYSTSNHNDQLKLGAKSSEEAARWRRTIMEAALKVFPPGEDNDLICIRSRWTSFSFSWRNSRSQKFSVDWSRSSSMHVDQMTCDVIEANPWEIFGYKHGLRLFKEPKDDNLQREHCDDHPAIMAVGIIDATPEEIFEMVMSFGPSRSEWDFCFANGNVVEHLDGHTDIIHKELRGDWLPWGMKPRDLLLKRYWREDDGTYVILYHSVYHPNCRPDRRFIRACLKSGGYVISPINQGRQSVVKHMLAIDWKSWKSYLFTSTAEHITIRMLERVASLRDMFQGKGGKFLRCDFSLGEVKRDMNCQRIEEMKLEVQFQEDITKTECIETSQMSQENSENMCGSVLEMNDAAEEFFDFLDESEYEQKDNVQASDSELKCQDLCISKQSTAAVLMKKLQDLAVQTKGYIGLDDDLMREDTGFFSYGCTLQKDSTCTLMSSCTMADPSTFLIRSKTYLRDHKKIMSSGTLMEMVGADWLKSHRREDDLGSRHGGIVQKYASKGGGEFFFIINIQVPGSTTYSLALYYMMREPVESVPLLDRFTKSDDAYRNSRFKLIPHISKGPWIVKQSVGKKACLVGRALEMNCFQGTNYLELGIDIGSSTVARGVVGLVLGYLNNLVIEMAFLIQGNTEEELPEFLIGTCRLNHLDVSKAVPIGLD